jgi:hypothetical protein
MSKRGFVLEISRDEEQTRLYFTLENGMLAWYSETTKVGGRNRKKEKKKKKETKRKKTKRKKKRKNKRKKKKLIVLDRGRNWAKQMQRPAPFEG